MSSTTVKVALLQQRCESAKEINLKRSLEGIKQAAEAGAQLIVLPELHATPYFCQVEDTTNFDLAEPIPGPTSTALANAAQQNQVVIVGSIFEKRAAGVYHNTAVVFDSDGTLSGSYRKMHIPDDPGYYEKFYFTPGDTGFQPIQTSIGMLGILVCWDQWFPEAARLMALAGAEILVYPTAIGWDQTDDDAEQARQLDAWMTIQRSHAIANGVYMLSCNRTGFETSPHDKNSGIAFWGNSFIAGPQGEILAQAHEPQVQDSQLIMCNIDKQRSEDVRRIWPYLRDRRIDAYEDLLRRIRD